MQAISEFLAMGGYAGFVWPAFVATLAVLLVLWLSSARELRNSQKTLADLDQQRPGR